MKRSRFRKEFPVSDDSQRNQIQAKFGNGILYLGDGAGGNQGSVGAGVEDEDGTSVQGAGVGAQGSVGVGTEGGIGVQGAGVGAQGSVGVSGTEGVVGAQGEDGAGAGAQGSVGVSGTEGVVGAQDSGVGAQGEDGAGAGAQPYEYWTVILSFWP
ncbi:hypothetical protein CRYUN_Cryun08bG0043100 [Craigia yunnanensis]